MYCVYNFVKFKNYSHLQLLDYRNSNRSYGRSEETVYFDVLSAMLNKGEQLGTWRNNGWHFSWQKLYHHCLWQIRIKASPSVVQFAMDINTYYILHTCIYTMYTARHRHGCVLHMKIVISCSPTSGKADDSITYLPWDCKQVLCSLYLLRVDSLQLTCSQLHNLRHHPVICACTGSCQRPTGPSPIHVPLPWLSVKNGKSRAHKCHKSTCTSKVVLIYRYKE